MNCNEIYAVYVKYTVCLICSNNCKSSVPTTHFSSSYEHQMALYAALMI